MTEPLDARGVAIAPGDTAIWGFGVGRSIAMAEGIVMGDVADDAKQTTTVSLTPSGRVRLHVVRRSYSDGVKPVVDVAADRMVVLRPPALAAHLGVLPYLPPSPLPTQDDEARADIGKHIDGAQDALRATKAPNYWAMPDESPEVTLGRYHTFYRHQLKRYQSQLKALDDE